MTALLRPILLAMSCLKKTRLWSSRILLRSLSVKLFALHLYAVEQAGNDRQMLKQRRHEQKCPGLSVSQLI